MISNASGTIAVTQSGTGTTTLSGSNSYTGGTKIGAGTISVVTGGNLGAIPGSYTANNIDFTGNSTLQMTAPFTFAVQRGITIDSGVTGTMEVTGANTVVAAQIITGAGGAMAKAGTGTLTLQGANTFTGGLTINAGTVQLGNTGALDSTAGSENAVAFGSGSTGTLALAGYNVVIANLNTNATPGTTYVQNANGASVSNATLTVGNSTNASGTFAGTIQDGTGGGTLALTKLGSGTLTLTGTTNTYTGGTTVSAGTLSFANGALGTTGNITVNGGALQWNSNTQDISARLVMLTSGSATLDTNGNSVSFANAIGSSSTSSLTKAGSGTLTLNGANTYTGGTTVGAGTLQLGNGSTTGSLSTTGTITDNGTLVFNRSNTVTQGTDFSNGAIGGSGSITQNGSGILHLLGVNTFSGGVLVNSGTLQIDNGAALGALPGSPAVQLTFGGNSTLQFFGSPALGANRGLAINSGMTATMDTQAFTPSIAGVISGSGALTKTGSGTVTFSAANTYNGATTISAGTLILTAGGDLASSSGVNLGTHSSRGTLDLTAKSSYTFALGKTVSGDGTIDIGAGKAVTIAGNFQPGNSPGQVNVTGDLTLTSTAATTMDLAGNAGVKGVDFDNSTSTGATTYGGILTIQSYGGYDINANPNVTYSLFDFASYTGNFTSVSVAGTSLSYGANVWTGTNSGTTYNFDLTNGDLTVVPEPATWALLAFSLTTVVVMRRRRNS